MVSTKMLYQINTPFLRHAQTTSAPQNHSSRPTPIESTSCEF